MYNRYQKLPIDIDLDHYTRHYVKVGTYDKIKVCKLYSHCMHIQFMHMCLIISLHGVVVFFGDYRIRRQIYVYM